MTHYANLETAAPTQFTTAERIQGAWDSFKSGCGRLGYAQVKTVLPGTLFACSIAMAISSMVAGIITEIQNSSPDVTYGEARYNYWSNLGECMKFGAPIGAAIGFIPSQILAVFTTLTGEEACNLWYLFVMCARR
jgi:hypothetical protein